MLSKLKKIYYQLMNYDIDTLISIKTNFQSNRFQWIKTDDPNKIGKIVEVRDVAPGRNGRFIALLSDGTQMDTDLVSSNLMMVSDDQPQLSIDEIRSINYIPSLSEEMKISPELPADIVAEIKSQPVQANPQDKPASRQSPERETSNVDPGDLFGMFSLEETELNLSIRLKLPSKSLLKMMYSNSKNKEEFLTRLSSYINNNVTADSIKKTMKRTLTGRAEKTVKD